MKPGSGKKIGISTKTSAICALIVLILLIVNGTIFLNLESSLVESIFKEYGANVSRALDEQGSLQKTELANNAQINAEICANAISIFVYTLDKDSVESTLREFLKLPWIDAIEVVKKDNKPFFAIWRQPQLTTGQSLENRQAFNQALAIKVDTVYDGENAGQLRFFYNDTKLQTALGQSKKKAGESFAAFKSTVNKRFRTASFIQAFVGLGVIMLLVIAILIILKLLVTRPLNALTATVMDLVEGEGDLTKRLKIISNDEIGILAGWFNRFIDNINEMITGIADSAGRFAASSADMATIAESLAESSGHMADRSNTITVAAEEMSSNMNQVAASTEEAAGNVNMAAASAEEMNATIDEIARNSSKANSITHNAVDKAGTASQRVDDLRSAADQISKVTEVITEISEQTNLLALNATIEAARAGEAGKGFAVVANEIKDLAKQTAEATQDIKAKISGIQNSTSETVAEIKEISAIIGDVNDIVTTIATAVEEQSAATREIARNVSGASEGLEKVSASISSSSSVSSTIAVDMSNVNKVTTQVSTDTEQVKAGAIELDRLARHLLQLIGKFRV